MVFPFSKMYFISLQTLRRTVMWGQGYVASQAHHLKPVKKQKPIVFQIWSHQSSGTPLTLSLTLLTPGSSVSLLAVGTHIWGYCSQSQVFPQIHFHFSSPGLLIASISVRQLSHISYSSLLNSIQHGACGQNSQDEFWLGHFPL